MQIQKNIRKRERRRNGERKRERFFHFVIAFVIVNLGKPKAYLFGFPRVYFLKPYIQFFLLL